MPALTPGPWTRRDTALGLGLALLLGGLHVAWAAADSSLPVNDDASLFETGACLYHGLAVQGLEALSRCSQGAPYPPGINIVALLHYLVGGGPALRLAVGSLWWAHALLAVATFAAVRHAAGRLAGVAAALLASVVVLDTGLRGGFYTEVAMAALGMAALALLSAPRGLRRPKVALALGAALGLGLLMKWSFAFFMGPFMVGVVAWSVGRSLLRPALGVAASLAAAAVPAALAAFAAGWGWGFGLAGLGLALVLGVALAFLAARRPGLMAPDGRALLLGVGLCAGAAALVAAPWYLAAHGAVAAFLATNLDRGYGGDPMGLAETWPFYPAVLVSWVQTPLLVMAGLGALRLLAPGRARLALVCFGIFLVFALVLTLLPYRTSRYLLPGLVLLAPLGVLGWVGLGRLAQGVWALLALLALVYHLGGLVPPPRWAAAWATPQIFGLGGNTRDGLFQAREFLQRPPLVLRPLARQPMPFGAPVEAMGQRITEQLGVDAPLYVVIAASSQLEPIDVHVGLAAARETRALRVEERRLVDLADLQAAARDGFGGCRLPAGRWPRGLVVIGARSGVLGPGPDDSPWPAALMDQAGMVPLWERPGTARQRDSYAIWWAGAEGIPCGG
ncbi:MAG: hypothetical protein ABIO70_22065 [Pseudomonadota bacterium]